MTAEPDSKKDHIECFISDTDLFTPAFVQSDIESGRYGDFYPITKLEVNGPIEFVINNVSDKFLDLNNSFLKVKVKLQKLMVEILHRRTESVPSITQRLLYLTKLIFSWLERLYQVQLIPILIELISKLC